jgi:hypothetical protein
MSTRPVLFARKRHPAAARPQKPVSCNARLCSSVLKIPPRRARPQMLQSKKHTPARARSTRGCQRSAPCVPAVRPSSKRNGPVFLRDSIISCAASVISSTSRNQFAIDSCCATFNKTCLRFDLTVSLNSLCDSSQRCGQDSFRVSGGREIF